MPLLNRVFYLGLARSIYLFAMRDPFPGLSMKLHDYDVEEVSD